VSFIVIERLFHARRGDWALPVALSALLLAIYLAVPGAAPDWRYDRAAILDGEAWRLVTGHLLHADVHHLGWNVFGVLLVWFLFARDYSPRQWLAILLLSTAVTSAGFLLLEPELDWYVGFSGVLHGCMAAGLVAWLRSTRDPLTWLVAGLFVAKLAWEHFQGALPFTAGTLTLPVVHEAHTYGAIGGLLAALWLGRGRHTSRSSL
jgi:rhomboid family GlyGly-CTERM serine protease